MFRRKEENTNDFNNEVNPALNLSGEVNNAPNSNVSQVNSSQASSPQASSPQASEPHHNEALLQSNGSNVNQGVSPHPSQLMRPNPAPAEAASQRPAAVNAVPNNAIPTPSANPYRPMPVSEFNNRPVNAQPATAPRQPEPLRPNNASATIAEVKPAEVKKSPRILTVGNDILLKGEIETCDRVIIEGRVEAKLSDVHTLAIAGCGSFKGTAEVEQAEITGLFEGDLIVNGRLVVYATGEVRGNITYGEIEIERGGKLTGQIKTVADSAQEKSAIKPTLLDTLETKKQKELMHA
jgi:cytoskeletal protein CcmA (bactofilin family)